MKTFFIIPGFKHRPSDRQYKWLYEHYGDKGFRIEKVKIDWDRKVMTDYIRQFAKYYNEKKLEQNYVLGFSFGAMIAYISAPKIKPDTLILCSLSAYFNEDLSYLKPWYKRTIGKRRITDFKEYSAGEIARNIETKTYVVYGSREGTEYPRHKYRNESAAKDITGARLTIAQDAPHQINYPSYIESLKGLKLK